MYGIGGGEWGEGAETSSPLEGARKGSRVGEQLCPVVPHTSSPSTYQSGPGKETGNRRGRHPLPTALQLRHSGSRSCVCSILPAHTAWLTPTGPPSTLTLYPRAAAQSLPTKHSQEVPVAGICSSPETCPAEAPSWPVHIQGLRNATLSPLAPPPAS